MKSPLCQLADVAIALHARENRSTISPPPLTAISTLTTGTTVTSVRSDTSLSPQHIRARRYAICIERERPAVDIAGALLTRQKQFQNYYQPQQQTQTTVRALPPLRYHYNPISFRQQTVSFRTSLRRVATVAQTVTTNDTINTTAMALVSTCDDVTASKKVKIEDINNKVSKSQKNLEDEQKMELQLKIKTVEQLQQEENLELLIKASEQHEKHLEKKEEKKEEDIKKVETKAANVGNQQVVEEMTGKEKEITIAAEIEIKTEKNLNVIDLTDSDDDTLSAGTISKTSTQCNHRRRKRHHRRHRRRQTQKIGLTVVKKKINEKATKSQEEKKEQK